MLHATDSNVCGSVMTVSGGKLDAVEVHSVCGTSPNGVVAFSNYKSDRVMGKCYVDGLFMGYRWQCVEYARRWLWLSKGLLLPTRICAFRYAGLSKVMRLKAAGEFLPSRISSVEYASEDTPASHSERHLHFREKSNWESVPCQFVKQGGRRPPSSDSLIIYPFTCTNFTGHIGVITEVDVDQRWVRVADQNRFFTPWVSAEGGSKLGYSAEFQLDCVDGCYFIRDEEDECSGWIEFPGYPNLCQSEEGAS